MDTLRGNSTVMKCGCGPSELGEAVRRAGNEKMRDVLPEGIRVLVGQTFGPESKFE